MDWGCGRFELQIAGVFFGRLGILEKVCWALNKWG
jgi:hypothetical protein